MKKIFIGIGAVVLLALAGRAGWAYYQVIAEKNVVAQLPVAHDIAPIDDSDLRLEKVVVADSENAYFDLIKIDKVIYWPKEKSQTIYDMVAGKTWDAQLAQELVSKNTEAFKYFTDASLKSKYQDPSFADPINISPDSILPPLNSFRSISNLSAVKAILLSNQSRGREAMDEAFLSVNIGQKMQDSQGNLIEYLVASAMKSIGLRTAQRIVSISKIKADDLVKYTQSITQYYKNEEGLVAAFMAERYFMFSYIDLTTAALIGGDKEALDLLNKMSDLGDPNIRVFEKLSGNYYFEPNKTKLLHADFLRSQIDDINTLCWDMRGSDIKKLDMSSIEELKKIENAVGIIMRDVVAKSLSGFPGKKCQEDVLVGATQTMFAIKAFKNDTKKYPTILDELVPKYLEVVPTDPFDGKQIKYSAEKKIVYSVGEDKQDDGGIMSDDGKKTPDIVYSIGF